MRDAQYYGSREEFSDLRNAWATAIKECATFRSRMLKKYGAEREYTATRTKAEQFRTRQVDTADYNAMEKFVVFLMRWYPVKPWRSTPFSEMLAVTWEDILRHQGYTL